ncbi:hypothetical protein [Micrococcoides hystricis]|uniref:Uncharacterized protein n=1 Tax=Micrococcoides hystricis TaxID=1572761 RepID=A0ABV6P9T6_9MICC
MDKYVMRLLDDGVDECFAADSLPVSLLEQHAIARRLRLFANLLPYVAEEVGAELVVLTIETVLARLKDVATLPTRPVDALLHTGETYLQLHREYAVQAGRKIEDVVYWLALDAGEGQPLPLLPDPRAYLSLLGDSGAQLLLNELSSSYSPVGKEAHEELLSEPSTRIRYMQMRLLSFATVNPSLREMAQAYSAHGPLMAYMIVTLLQFGRTELARELHQHATFSSSSLDTQLVELMWNALLNHGSSAPPGGTPNSFHVLFQTTLLFEQWPSAVVARQLRHRSGPLWQVYFQPHIEGILASHPDQLMRYYMHEHDYQRAWEWSQEHGWDPTGRNAEVWLELLSRVAPSLPEEALRTIEQKVAALIELQTARSYDLACRYLQLYRALTNAGNGHDFQRWISELRTRYARRTQFLAALDMAGL